MPPMNTGPMMSFTLPNFSGLLYNKSNTTTPFFSRCGAPRYIDRVEFVTNLDFVNDDPSQPSISEQASLEAPTPKFITQTQATNLTQVFHEAVQISYAKQSNMGTMNGLNKLLGRGVLRSYFNGLRRGLQVPL